MSHMGEFAGAVELAESRRQGLHDSVERNIDADIDGCADRQRTEIGDGIARDHRGIEYGIGDGGQLTDPDRQRQMDDACGMAGKAVSVFHSIDR